jgi:hypothetical protein
MECRFAREAEVRDRRAIVQLRGLPRRADIRERKRAAYRMCGYGLDKRSKQKPPQSGGFCDIKAEGERFELSDDVTAVNGFRDLRDGLRRPLRREDRYGAARVSRVATAITRKR